MVGNIECFTASCNNPVIGQCSGYKGNCGQFYCHIHSSGKLCNECGTREAIDRTYQDYLETLEAIDRTYQDYLKTAENIEKPVMSIGFAIVIIIITVIAVLSLKGCTTDQIGHWAGLAVLAVLAILFICGLIWNEVMLNKKANKAIDEANKIKPGFRKFYLMYKKAQAAAGRMGLKEEFLGLLIADIEKIKPGFRKFYLMYKEAENKKLKEEFMEGVLELFGVVVAGVAAGIGAGAKQMVRDVSSPAEISGGTPRDVVSAIQSLEKTIAEKK